MQKIIIAIDGPAGSGKTTTARKVAEALGYTYIDTGAMYRAVTLAWLNSGMDLNEDNLKLILNNISLELKISDSGQRTILNSKDVSSDIRLPEVTKYVSPVSALKCVRDDMVARQRKMGNEGGVVMDGRDIGTVVFPNAHLKIFLLATIEARGERRALELKNAGFEVDIEEIRRQITERDIYDSTRENSPLKKAEDAIVVDTSDITIEQQTEIVLSYAKKLISE